MLSVQTGEYVCIVGRSSSGKSTSVNLVLGLIAPTRSTVRACSV
jgi:ABC-type nitrate/sulfonate/bicarbonate transport system ATPase subunit